jgi:hypothetical protein
LSVPAAVVPKQVKLVQSTLNVTKSKPSATLDLCESDDDSVDVKALSSLSLNASSAPSRASRPVSKISYKDDDDEEELVSSSEDDEPKKKAAPVKPKAAIKKTVSAVTSAPGSKIQGVKRPKKASGESEEVRRVMEVYSPGMVSPEAVKKPRKNISAPAVSAAGAALKAASKAKPVLPASKVVKSSKRIVESDGDEEDKEEEPVGPRTPKPTRQRAAVKSYVQSESEESEDEEDEEEEESDYESS